MADDDDLTYQAASDSSKRHFLYASESDRYPKPVVRRGRPRKLAPIEKVCTGFAWFVCVWLIFAGGLRVWLMLDGGYPLDFMPFTGMVLGLIGLLLMTCLHDEWKTRK